ncbi:GntP family permease [Marinoscillum luteum]|uniref:GntP family permease n=1 Tax=Marinoscillum luteum TaxID=861051 RepID=A0ABW7NDW7_9BACT
MINSFLYVFLWLLAGIAVIVLLTTRFKVHPFFALIIAGFVVGIGVGMPVSEVLTHVKNGFGNILKSLGLVIVLGITLGVILEHTGSTRVMAGFIRKLVNEKRAALAMNLTGFSVGTLIFCDSGFIVLDGLNNSLARKTKVPIATMAVSLAAGLYAIHCMIPPHPGAAAAAEIIGVDFGQLIMAGIVVAIPTSLVGFWWATYAGKKNPVVLADEEEQESDLPDHSVIRAFLPIIAPILLIAIRSFIALDAPDQNWVISVLVTIGDPVIALAIGVLLAFNTKRGWQKNTVSHLMQDAVQKSGGILVIIGAGAAFGAVLVAINIGEYVNQAIPLEGLGILFPFLLAFILKTAQGSSTVAVITAASIVQPLLPNLGITTEMGYLLCVLSMGAGSIMISHANDSYFWVISKFSGVGMREMLRVYSVATILMGLTSFIMVYLLSLILL